MHEFLPYTGSFARPRILLLAPALLVLLHFAALVRTAHSLAPKLMGKMIFVRELERLHFLRVQPIVPSFHQV